MTAPTKLRPSDTGACGTPAGYSRHYRRHEDPCEPCRQARIVDRRAYREAAAALRALRPPDLTGAKPLPSGLGRFAGVYVPHAFRQLGPSMGATQGVDCFGWIDDGRHL